MDKEKKPEDVVEDVEELLDSESVKSESSDDEKEEFSDDVLRDIDSAEKSENAIIDDAPTRPEKDSGKDTRNLLIMVGVIVLIFVAFLGVRYIQGDGATSKSSLTVQDLHDLNLKGKLTVGQGYVYNGFSFVKHTDLWHTNVQQGDTMYSLTFNHGPVDVENISVRGKLDKDFFDDGLISITFDPTGQDLQYIAVANYGFSRSLAKAFQYELEAGCSINETKDCRTETIITCDDEDRSVVFFKEGNETVILYEGNCVSIQGRGQEIVRAKDRLLMRWYGIMN